MRRSPTAVPADCPDPPGVTTPDSVLSSGWWAPRQAQAAVEMALGLPLLLLLIIGIVDFGRVFFTNAQLNNGVAEGSRYAALDRTESAVIDKTKAYAGTLDPASLNITMVCYSGSTPTIKTCSSAVAGDTVKVTATTEFSPITPLLTTIIGGPIIVTTSSQRTAQ